MFRRLIFLLCLPILFLQCNEESKYSTAPPADWVKFCDFSLESIPIKPRQEHYQILLVDIQRNWEEKATYIHSAIKVVDQIGIDGVSQVRLDFDPSYQHLVVHRIRIYRDGQWFDRIETSRRDLLQREEELDSGLFDGRLTLVYFLNDIRVGDILEYSYTLIGEHPTFSSHFADIIYLEDYYGWEKVYRRILIHPERPFSMKFFNTLQEPRVTDISSTLREYVWEAVGTIPGCDDDEQPDWHQPEAHIQISQYVTWQQLALDLVPLYALSSDFYQNPSSEMIELVEFWKASSEDSAERALMALRFVQDKIRYLGFEDGIGAVVPRDPRIILQRRFGDCKDKSVLLRTLLGLMEIRANSVLVHASRGQRLPEMLPTPLIFNHAILQLEINGKFYYVDPTMSFQGGSLQDNYFPRYQWGLVISDKTTELTQLPEPFFRPQTEIDTSIVFTSPTSADLKSTMICYGDHADNLRRTLQEEGLKKITKDLLEGIQTDYKGASIITPMVITDNREKNIITLINSYKITPRNRSGKKILKVISDIIDTGLDDSINLERASPFVLTYPYWIKEHIHVKNPFNTWPADSEDITLENESIRYNFTMKKEGQTADYTIELKHLKDHVPLNAVQDYWHIIQEIEPSPSLELIVSAH